MKNCTLCGNPIKGNSYSSPDIEGEFCCMGCLRVCEILGEADDLFIQEMKERVAGTYRSSQSEAIPDSSKDTFFRVDGMRCSTCEKFIQLIIERQSGVYKCEASYASELMRIIHVPDMDLKPISEILSYYGYRVYPSHGGELSDRDTDEIGRLVLGGFFSLIGLFLYVIFLYPLYGGWGGVIDIDSSESFFVISNIGVMTTFVVFYTSYPILRGAYVSIRIMRPDMNLLITISALSAYIYSVISLFIGNSDVYFDVSMAIIMVVSLGTYYEKKIRRRLTSLLSKIVFSSSEKVNVVRDNSLVSVDISDLIPGDKVIVRSGERIPVDGVVYEGEATVNESLLTGEFMPVRKSKGDKVLGGTVVSDNMLIVEIGEKIESTMDRIMRLMWSIQTSSPSTSRVVDKIAYFFIPGVITVAFVALGYHLLQGNSVTNSMLIFLSVLIVSCPCTLGLAMPLAIASGLRESLGRRIVIRDISVFERGSNIDTIVFDKTGTLSTGDLHLLFSGNKRSNLLLAKKIEQFSNHPIAKAIRGKFRGFSHDVKEFRSFPRGVSAKVGGRLIWVGDPFWLVEEKGFQIPLSIRKKVEDAYSDHTIPVVIGWDGKIQDVFIVGEKLRDETIEVLKYLRKVCRSIALITGDTETSVKRLKSVLNTDLIFTGITPEAKSEIVKRLKVNGTVAMIGDGNNDALALASADIGMAFGTAALVVDSADLVILEDDLGKVISALNILRFTRKRLRQNLFWAFFYNIVAIPLAASGLINPLFAAIAMISSSTLVVLNSTRKMSEKRSSASFNIMCI